MTRATQWLLPMIAGAFGCTDFIDLDAHDFSCQSDADCAEGRVCARDQCTAEAESPLPAYGVLIRDTSSGGSCATASPGSDIFAVAVAPRGKPIVALGTPTSWDPSRRGFVPGVGPNEFVDPTRWNWFLTNGADVPGNCPALVPGEVVSLGCGGELFLTFSQAPWVGPDSGAPFGITADHEILVFEHGRQCGVDGVYAELLDSYEVRICLRDAYPAGASGEDIERSDCMPLGLDQSGLTSHPVELRR